MAESIGVLDLSFKAAGDLSAKQYHFMKVSAENTIDTSGANERAIGILQDKPNAANEASSVRVVGTSKLKYGDTIALGQMITSKSDGTGEVVNAASEWVGALALQGGVSGDIKEVLIVHFDAHESE